MAPRITISLRDGELNIDMNEAGRALLVKEINGLDARWDHIHLTTDQLCAEVPLRSIPYSPGDEIIDYAKISLRLEEWDRQYFPQVLEDEPTAPNDG